MVYFENYFSPSWNQSFVFHTFPFPAERLFRIKALAPKPIKAVKRGITVYWESSYSHEIEGTPRECQCVWTPRSMFGQAHSGFPGIELCICLIRFCYFEQSFKVIYAFENEQGCFFVLAEGNHSTYMIFVVLSLWYNAHEL